MRHLSEMMDFSCPFNGQTATDTTEFFGIFFKDSGELGWGDQSKTRAIRLDREGDSLYVIKITSVSG